LARLNKCAISVEEVCGRNSNVVKCERNPPAERSRQLAMRGPSEVVHILVASVSGEVGYRDSGNRSIQIDAARQLMRQQEPFTHAKEIESFVSARS